MQLILKIKQIINKYKKLIFIILFAAILMFYRLDQVDLVADDAHYATRSVGMLDTLFSPFQQTPINWFNPLPWWAYLSFHDHPTPLLFLIQHLFLSINESVLFAKLPFTFMALASIALVYAIVKGLFREREDKEIFAIFSAGAMALSNGVIWAGRYSHMEGGVMFFSLIAILIFIKYTKNYKLWKWFGVGIGLVLLTKYNALFIIPSIGIYIILFHKDLLKNKNFYKSWLIILLLISPIIIYNLMLYKTRGHFDAQLSRLFNLDNPWSLAGAEGGLSQVGKLFDGIGKFVSYPYFAAALVGLFFGLKQNKKFWLMGLNLIFILLFITIVGVDPRFFILLTPFLAISLGYLLLIFYNYKKPVAKIGIGIFAIFLIVFIIRSHSFLEITQSQGWFVSAQVSENYGFSQLDKFLNTYVEDLTKNEGMHTIDAGKDRKNLKKGLGKYHNSPNKVGAYKDLNHIFLYDDALIWFPRMWVFERRLFYHNLPFFDGVTISTIQNELNIDYKNLNLHLIKGVDERAYQSKDKTSGLAKNVENFMIGQGVEAEVVRNSLGNEAFKIYRYQGNFDFKSPE